MSQRKSAVLIPFFSPSSVFGRTTPGGEGASSVVGARRGERSSDMLVWERRDESDWVADLEWKWRRRSAPTEQARFS